MIASDPRHPHVLALASFFALMYAVQSLGDPSSGLMAQPVRALLKQWDVGAGEIAFFMAIVGLPWALKPVFGLLSDFLPLFGSRRRNYLILATLSALIGCLALAGAPWLANERWVLLGVLLLPAVGVAFGDVLIDGLMVTEGQPRGLTGVLQSVQWTASYAGLLATGIVGGYFSQIARPDLAFGVCAVLWGTSLLLAVIVVREPERVAIPDAGALRRTIREVLTTRGMLPVAVILFIWSFNPLWSTVIYIHLTEVLGFSEVEFGHFLSFFGFGAMLGAALYPVYCRRITLGTLVHASIIAGIVGNLLYFALPAGGAGSGQTIAAAVGVFAGATYMTGSMVQLDVAARRAPLIAAATIFALLMALTNLASSLSEAAGGAIYETLRSRSNALGFEVVVWLSALIPALCWLAVPRLHRDLPEWFGTRPIAARAPAGDDA